MMKPSLATVITLTIVLALPLFVIIPIKNHYLHEYGKSLNGRFVLPDIVHNHFKYYPMYSILAEFFTAIIIAIFIIVSLFTKQWYHLAIFSLAFIIITYFNIFYSILTILPDSKNGKCNYSKTLVEQITTAGTCNDLNLSGHAISVFIALYLLSLRQKHNYSPIYIAIYIITIAFIVLSRNHYTIDVINSTFLSIILTTIWLRHL